ncbi:MAG: VWA domain-containing protein [Candidatus Hydrogenedentes bacterium]|nr:VWA domain-containing protein [Candidatus Hydrogenedentota bacterium]
MLSRRAMLLVSFVAAVALYSGLYAIAPNIFLIRANSAVDAFPNRLRVELLDSVTLERFDPAPDDAVTMASRPGSVRDLIEQETEHLPLQDTDWEPQEEAVALAERVSQAGMTREHDLVRDPDVAAGIEARIIEIAQDVARKDIEIARRYVRASPNRLLKDGENIGAGGAGVRGGEILGLGALQAPVPGGEAANRATSEGRGALEGGQAGERMLFPEFDAPILPALPDETLLGGEFARRNIQRESPYERMDHIVDIRAATYVDPITGQGFFRLEIFPVAGGKVEVLPKDVTFLVDASNSILQRKLDLTVRGLKACLSLLRPEDRFNVVVFRDNPRSFRERPIPVSEEAIEEAIAFLEGMESGGSTDLYKAVLSVIGESPRTGLPGIVVVLSDGRPTTGNFSGRELINALTAENDNGNTIFTFGGGNTVNRYLMDLLAYRNKGMSVVTRRVEDIDDELPVFFEQINDALLVNLRADYGRIDAESVYPRTLPDFYRGRVLTVYGQFDSARDTELVLRLKGEAGAAKKDMVLKASLEAASRGDRSIAQGWAFEKSYHLIGEMTRVGETPELMGELRRLSEEFKVQTSYFH